jgi:amino acid transporter
MKVTGALLLTVSAITPAASVYVIVPGIIQQAGTGAVLSLAVAALIGLGMAFIYAELGSAHPIAGGEYTLFGRTLGPLVGFAYMGMNAISCGFAPAVLALGAGNYLRAVWPDLPVTAVALGIVGFATLVGVLNIRTNAVITGLFLGVELLALVVLAVLGFVHPSRSPVELVLHPVTLIAGQLAPAPLSAIGLAMAVAIFAYNGFGAAVYFSEEMVGASSRVARTIVLALLITVAFEFIPTFAVLMGAPDLKALIASANPFTDFVTQRGGRALSIAISLGVALATVNALIAIVLTFARFFYASGRDRAWPEPVNVAMTRLHPRFHSPWVANLTAGGIAAVGCFLPFHLLLVLNGTGVVVMYALLCVGVVAGRRNGSTAHGLYRMPFYPLAPVLGLAALAYVLYANWLDPDVGRPSLIATVVIAGLALAYCLVMRRRRGPAWAITGPAEEQA